MCCHDAAITPVGFTNGLEINFYPDLTPPMSSLALLEAKIPSLMWTTCNDSSDISFFMVVLVVDDCCSGWCDGSGGDGVHGGSILRPEVGIE